MTRRITRKILLVDGSPDDRDMIQRLLGSQHREYIVVEALTGAEGLRMVEAEKPDCVLLDFYLPDMEGTAFLDELTVDRSSTLAAPTAVLTADQRDDVATDVLRRGAQDYMVKDGLTGPALVRVIENTIEKYRIQKELVESRLAIELRNRKLAMLRDQLQEKVTELAQATKAKDQFMAVMSHEMRTPLNAIIGYADLLDMQLDGTLTREQHEKIERIQVGSRHLLALINDILDLARAEAERLELDLRPVDLGAVLDEVATLLERQAGEKGISLIIEPLPSDLPNVKADLNRLRQILTNLIGNAIKFTEDGEVRIRCEAAEDDQVKVHVADTGIGIEPEVLPLVFTEFYQARGELTREKGGTGLGLAIAQKLADLMGGDIQARSRLGEGSTFTLILQAADAGSELRVEDVVRHAARSEFEAAAKELIREGQKGVRVVAFGDQVEALSELERQVHPGVQLVWTTDADEVPELAEEHKATLVVLDISCREGAAWRAAHRLQQSTELTNTAILLLPSIPSVATDTTSGGLDLGWLSLVPKPFTAAQLTQAVSTAARRSEDPAAEDEKLYDVLVVDDDPDSRRVAAKFLSAANLQVREAPDGESALAEMHRLRPDVVVLDLMMPVLDGFGVLATMRADPDLARIPVVVLTAKTLTEAERQFLAKTAVRVLQKGEHRLADVASLVLRAAARTGGGMAALQP